MMWKVFLVFCISVIACSCQKQGLKEESRTSGEITFRTNCQTCHILPKATMKTDAEWPAIVGRYGEKAKLSEAQKADILLYLTSNN